MKGCSETPPGPDAAAGGGDCPEIPERRVPLPGCENLPEGPGIYRFLDADEGLLYVGKALNLRRRVLSYFGRPQTPKTRLMLGLAARVEVVLTRTEQEALLLEANQIRETQPRYNIDLKDDKGFAYLGLTREAFPRLRLVRRVTEAKKWELFGPFVSGTERNRLQRLLIRLFRLPTCHHFPLRPCLRHQMGLCDAPCAGLLDAEAYALRIASVRSVLRGDTHELEARWKVEMEEASAQLDFERALELRERLEALEHLRERQRVQNQRRLDEDVLVWSRGDDGVWGMLFPVRRGILGLPETWSLPPGAELEREEYLLAYYQNHPVPHELIVEAPLPGELVQDLEEIRGASLLVTIPQRGRKKDLVDLARENLRQRRETQSGTLLGLARDLDLPRPPRRMECIDISHLGGRDAVASLVVFEQGRPQKKAYRRYRIRTFEGNDDTRAMGEVVRRRVRRMLEEDGPCPDLVLIDGGVPQLHAAERALEEMGVMLPLAALAKREELLYRPGREEPIRLDDRDAGLRMLRYLRDEAHRFAGAYQRILRHRQAGQNRGVGREEAE